METPTRFDLEAAIANWQHELAAQADLTPIVRRELETHLRDTVAELQARGLNNEESFWLARRRLGQPPQLNSAFASGDPTKVWHERVFWLVLALLTINLWSVTSNYLFFLFTKDVRVRTGGFVMLINGARLFLNWAPILIVAILLATGRFDFTSKRWLSFFGSRFRLAAIATVWILYNSGVQVGYELAQNHSNSIARVVIWTNLFYMTIWPSILLALLMWLMPRRTPSISKIA